MKTPPVSIIIPTLNEEQYLPLLLDSLKNVTSDLDIIVVDGASEDRTTEVVKEFQPHFKDASSLTLILSETRGISLQRNLGALQAKHDLLIFCDADVLFSSNEMYTKLVSTFQEKKYVMAAPILTPIESGFHISLTYHVAEVMERIANLFGRPYFPGSCLITTKEVFKATGGFDTNIMLAEDIDYSMRAAKLGRSGLINVSMPVSARRFIKYGYSWILSEIPNLLRLIFTGRIKHESIYYPFGEYGGQKAHHVTKNTGKVPTPSRTPSS